MATASIGSDEPGKSTSSTRVAKPPPDSPPEVQLKRFLYLNEPNLSFTTGNPELHGHFKRENLNCIGELLKSEDPTQRELFFNIVENVSRTNVLPRRDNLYYVLALAATSDFTNSDLNRRIYRMVSSMNKCDAEYFAFIRYFSLEGKSLPTGLNKSISRFYYNKDPVQLAKDCIQFQGYRGWKHRDLIKLSHAKSYVKPKQLKKGTYAVITYLLHGLEKAELEVDTSEESQKVLELLTNAWEYRTANDENKILELLPKLTTFTHLQLSPNLHKSFLIWNAIFTRFTLEELLNKLLFFYKCEFFQKEEFLNNIIERVTNADFIEESKIHPFTVFIICRNFERGGKPKNPKLVNFLDEEEDRRQAKRKGPAPDYIKPNFRYIEAIKCPSLIAALRMTMTLSYSNVSELGKRYMITIEVSEDMNKPCLTNSGITCLEAAVVIALSLYKAEKNVTIGVFNGVDITPLSFDKACSFPGALAKVKEAAHGYVAYGQPINWASAKKKQVDIFVNLVHNVIPRRLPKGVVCNPAPALERYHKEKGSSLNTKLILHSLGRAGGNYYDARHSYILNLHGFDDSIAPLISAFVTDKF